MPYTGRNARLAAPPRSPPPLRYLVALLGSGAESGANTLARVAQPRRDERPSKFRSAVWAIIALQRIKRLRARWQLRRGVES